MAGWNVGDEHVDRRYGHGDLHFLAGQQLGDVPNTFAEFFSADVTHQPPVFLHQRATPGAVHDDRFVTIAEGRDVDAGESAGFVYQTRVSVQRTAAHLAWDFADIEAVHG